MIYLILILSIYCGYSFYHCLKLIGNKFHKDTLIDYLLCPPFMIVVYIFAAILFCYKNSWCIIGIHKWIYTTNEERYCDRCDKKQRLDIHCLGMNPPEYIKEWINTK